MPEKMSLDEFLGRRGLQSPIGDYGLDKCKLPHGETQRQRTKRLQEGQAARETYSSQRKAAIAEYEDKVKRGEIIPKTTVERLVDRAHGHPDNLSVQAARRGLAKRGIDWQTGEQLDTDKFIKLPGIASEDLMISKWTPEDMTKSEQKVETAEPEEEPEL